MMHGQRNKVADGGMWFFGFVVLLIGLLNVVMPRDYLVFGVNHVSFLPISFQMGWMITCLIVIAIIGWRRKTFPWPADMLYLVAILFIASLFIFRTAFPAVHGDGAMGASPYNGAVPILSAYPDVHARLQSFLSYGLAHIIPPSIQFDIHSNSLRYDQQLTNAWLLLNILAGTFVIVFVTRMLQRMPWATGAKVGVQVILLSAPAMVNAYGHFDSYTIPVACMYLWIGSLYLFITGEDRLRNTLLVVMTVLLCAWAHPVLTATAYISLVAWVLHTCSARHIAIPRAMIVLAGIVFGLLPFAVGQGNTDLMKAENTTILHWLLHEKVMSCIQVGLPGLLLAGWIYAKDRSVGIRPSTLQRVALVTLLGSVIMFFTLWVGYGVWDEFLYALLGMFIVGAAVFLFIDSRVDHRVVAYAAVVSMYLFFPKVVVYSSEAILARFDDHLLHDRCAANRRVSPYRLAALSWPVDEEIYRQRRLDLLEEGFLEPLPHLKEFQVENLMFYVAWCFEFNQLENGYLQLRWLFDYKPDHLPGLWHWEDQLHTSRYEYKARYISRHLSRKLIEEGLEKDADDMALQDLLHKLEYFERQDPSPYRVTIDPSLIPEGFKNWNK